MIPIVGQSTGSAIAKFDDETLAEARQLIGVELRSASGSIEITREAIERAATMTGSRNPIYFDREYAKRTRWGALLYPPAKLPYVVVAPKLRGVQAVDAETTWDFHSPVREGDLISYRGRLVEAVELQGRTVPRMILQKGEVIYRNQRDEIVAVAHTGVMRVPRTRKSGGLSYEPRAASYCPEELARAQAMIRGEAIRGPVVRYWEDVAEGDELPPYVFGPLRVAEIAFGGPGGAAHVYGLLNRRQRPENVHHDAKSGVDDDPHQAHFESSMAKEVGMPGIYDYGPHRIGWLGRIVDWLGDDAFLTRLSGRLQRPNIMGDITFVHGRVTGKTVDRDQRFVDLDLTARNQLGEITMSATATARLCSRGA